jgi:phosphoribosylanthranilate isomerase
MIRPIKNTRVKICGITSISDALSAVEAGADAIGLVFYEPSPRYVSIVQAAEIAKAVGPFVSVVGLFVNASDDYIQQVLKRVNLHVLQFHGDETEDFCRKFSRPYMKAIRMKPGIIVQEQMNHFSSAAGILLDAYQKGVPGGTGEVFDWERVPKPLDGEPLLPIILAGGLTPDNVTRAISITEVYGVDVSGGVELLPGKKDIELVNEFISQVKQM